jgi:hypothetical protein
MKKKDFSLNQTFRIAQYNDFTDSRVDCFIFLRISFLVKIICDKNENNQEKKKKCDRKNYMNLFIVFPSDEIHELMYVILPQIFH